MSEFLAGRDAGQYDKTDWDISRVPVYLNAENLPRDVPQHEAERMVHESLLSWSRYSTEFYYAGTTPDEYSAGAVTINYQRGAQLAEWYRDDVNGVCFTRTKGQNLQKGNKWVEGCRIYINSDNRPIADHNALATITHELGHSCGIHGHNDKWGSVMYRSSMGNFRPTIHDLQMLDRFNPDFVQLHGDMSLSCPIVALGDGTKQFIHLLPASENPLKHSWKIGTHHIWDAPASDLIRQGEVTEFEGRPAVRIYLDDVRGIDINCRAQLLFTPDDGRLHLEYAGA